MTSISFDPKVNNTTSVSTSSKAENRGDTDIIKTSNNLYSDKVETGSSGGLAISRKSIWILMEMKLNSR